MKNILLLTDFSENAQTAARTALVLSQRLHTDLLLLNTYVFQPTVENYVGGWTADLFNTAEEAKQERLFALKQQLEELGHKTISPGDRRPVIKTQVETSILTLGINEILEHNHVGLIVMGSHEKELLGNNHVYETIRNTNIPVLVVPPKTDLETISKMIYATDYDYGDIDAIQFVAKIARAFDLEVSVVHVTTHPETKVEEKDRVIFEDHFKKIHNSRISYQVVRGNNVSESLMKIAKTKHAGLMAMLHYHRSFFDRLFAHSDTRELLETENNLLLIFPAKN